MRLFQIPLFILPTPSNVFVALYRGFASALYIDHIWITVTETLLGFVLGTSLAFLLGTVIALSRPVEYFLYPFVVMFQAMPKVALAPLIIVWFGLGLTSKVVNAALVAFFPLMVNTIVGLRSAEEDKVNLMKSLAATRDADLLDAAIAERHALHLRRAGDRDDLRADRRDRRRIRRRAVRPRHADPEHELHHGRGRPVLGAAAALDASGLGSTGSSSACGGACCSGTPRRNSSDEAAKKEAA